MDVEGLGQRSLADGDCDETIEVVTIIGVNFRVPLTAGEPTL